MKTIFKTITALILSFISFSSLAMGLPFSMPSELLVQGKPIPPICFTAYVNLLEQGNKVVSLQEDPCLKVNKAYSPTALKNGFLGYDLPNKPEHSMRPPAIYYRYVGKLKNTYYFEINYSGGGSGFFSSLMGFEIHNNDLALTKVVDTGDRCLGGISGSKIANGKLTYQKKLTPFALMRMVTTFNNRTPQAMSLYPDCAVCCIGELTIKGEFPVSFKFNGELLNSTGDTPAVTCVNKRLKLAGATAKKELNIKALRALVVSIDGACNK